MMQGRASSQEACWRTDAIVACSCKVFADERFEKRLEGVDDSIGQVFAGIKDFVEYTLKLVDNYKPPLVGNSTQNGDTYLGREYCRERGDCI